MSDPKSIAPQPIPCLWSAALHIRCYFFSGWAFLIPYLAAYLLYYLLKWPVNTASGEGTVKVASEIGMWVPCLLHVYWILHATNAFLAVIALVSWWGRQGKGDEKRETGDRRQESEVRGQRSGVGSPDSESAVSSEPSLEPSVSRFPNFPISRLADRFPAFLPWFLLALLFFIPGVYLEFPADSWEHFSRINDWARHAQVGTHPYWLKQSYLLAYSVIGRVTPATRQLFWFDGYYTGCCLLLCWQYYRLARVSGLGDRASMIFVLVQSLLFGNNLFGFYRYYGMSSTVFSQLGAVALIRMGLEVASSKFQFPRLKFQRTSAEALQETKGTEEMVPRGTRRLSASRFRLKALSSAAFCVVCLLALITFNHVQGLGIAGLGLLAVSVWRLIEWKRSMVFWLAVAAITLSVVAILWWPRHPALDQLYRPAGWLTPWYGLNLFSPSSPAFGLTTAILGFLGILNLFAGLLLLGQNRFVAWLTIVPFAALCMPFIAIPFANILAQRDASGIISFSRMFLAAPTGLAIVVLIKNLPNATRIGVGRFAYGHLAFLFPPRYSVLILGLVVLLLVPADAPYYNRFWNTLVVPPGDLALSHLIIDLGKPPVKRDQDTAPVRLLTTPGLAFAASATGVNRVAYLDGRLITYPHASPPSVRTRVLLDATALAAGEAIENILLIPPSSLLYTPNSLAGFLSTHWLPQEVALEHAAAPEIETCARALGGKEFKTAEATYFLFGDWSAAVGPRR